MMFNRLHKQHAATVLLGLITASCAITQPTQLASPDAYAPLSTTLLTADGPNGQATLDIIYAALGDGSVESPGLYKSDHYGVDHVYEETDDTIGNHFVFSIHLDEDGDRGEFIDRQRNEMKVFDGSDDVLKGYEGTSFRYRWQFNIPEGMAFSKNATHLFQLKMKDGRDSSPILTITLSKDRTGIDTLQLRYVPDDKGSEVVASVPISEVSGQWLSVEAFATFAEQGQLQFSVTRMMDQAQLIDVTDQNINMWRKIRTGKVGYVRPKWGLYRRIDDRSNLRSDEEIIRFANFEISQMEHSNQ